MGLTLVSVITEQKEQLRKGMRNNWDPDWVDFRRIVKFDQPPMLVIA